MHPQVHGNNNSGNVVHEVRPVLATRQLFIDGYRDAGGPFDKLTHMLDVVTCESSWNNIYGYDGPNGYLSVAQFDPESWRKAGGGDPFDLYQTGGNVARWIRMIGPENAGTTSGWPVCFWEGL